VKDVEISVFDSNTVKIGRRKGLSMKGGRILLVTLATNADKVSVLIDAPVTDIAGSLRLSFLVKEDNGVEVRLSTIILYPSFARMIGVFEVTSEWGGKANRLRGGSGSGNSRLVLGEANGLVAVDAIVGHVWFGEVKDVWYEKEVLYCLEVTVGGLEGFVIESIIA